MGILYLSKIFIVYIPTIDDIIPVATTISGKIIALSPKIVPLKPCTATIDPIIREAIVVSVSD